MSGVGYDELGECDVEEGNIGECCMEEGKVGECDVEEGKVRHRNLIS